MFGEIGCCIPNQRYMYNTRVESEMGEIWGLTNIACMNFKFRYVSYSIKEVRGQKIKLKCFWKECFAKLGAPSQSEVLYMYNIRVEPKMAEILRADEFCIYEFDI